MKRLFGLILLAAITLTACDKGDNNSGPCPTVNATAPSSEVAALAEYLTANNITATADPRGFFYTIITPGSAAKPTVCQTVNVAYEGKFTNGNVFDSSGDINFPLSRLITGWQLGIPLIGSGGSIILYLPPSLAYGAGGQGSIPPNSILIFNIDLKGFN